MIRIISQNCVAKYIIASCQGCASTLSLLGRCPSLRPVETGILVLLQVDMSIEIRILTAQHATSTGAHVQYSMDNSTGDHTWYSVAKTKLIYSREHMELRFCISHFDHNVEKSRLFVTS